MTTILDRAEINRRNSRKSTGPRTPEGKMQSRMNAIKHGCRAKLPILPGEDPQAYQDRLEAWIGKFDPRDAVELYLVEHAVHVSWQLDRADRAEAGRFERRSDAGAARQAEEVAKLGADLFRVPEGTLWCYPDRAGDPEVTPVSWPFDPGHQQHPSRLLAELEATALGCAWLIEQWSALGKLLDDGLNWQPPDRLRAIRLLGKQPLDVADAEPVMAIYLACHAMDPEGPEAFAEPLGEVAGSEAEVFRKRLAGRSSGSWGERAPRGASAGRAALRAMVVAAVARLVEVRESHRREEASVAATVTARDSFDSNETSEWLRRHQGTCSRTLFRTFDALAEGAAGLRRQPGGGRRARGVAGSRPVHRRGEGFQPLC